MKQAGDLGHLWQPSVSLVAKSDEFIRQATIIRELQLLLPRGCCLVTLAFLPCSCCLYMSQRCWSGAAETEVESLCHAPKSSPHPPLLFLARDLLQVGKFHLEREQGQLEGWGDRDEMKLSAFSSGAIALRCYFFFLIPVFLELLLWVIECSQICFYSLVDAYY